MTDLDRDSMELRALAAEDALAKMTMERDVAVRANGAKIAELQRKIAAQHIELMRRHRRDAELAYYLPKIAARLQVMAAEAGQGPAPKSWEDDPEIDWTGIER